MNPPPTIVHAAADFRRAALLAEAAAARRATFTPGRNANARRGARSRQIAGRIVAVVGWIIDDFEPVPRQISRNPDRLGS